MMLTHRTLRRLAAWSGAALFTTASLTAPAHAQDLVLPSCKKFDVGITFVDSHGNPVQAGSRNVLAAGSQTVILTNESTGASIKVQIAGAVTDAVFNPADGSTTFTVTGPNALFLFATDPGGPASTLFAGRVTIRQGADGTTTFLSSTGSTVDLCAALAG